MKKQTCYCDLCEAEVTNQPDNQGKKMTVIFETEQNEGRTSEPYLVDKWVDICKDCLAKVLQGNPVYCSGAMGHDNFYFKVKEVPKESIFVVYLNDNSHTMIEEYKDEETMHKAIEKNIERGLIPVTAFQGRLRPEFASQA